MALRPPAPRKRPHPGAGPVRHRDRPLPPTPCLLGCPADRQCPATSGLDPAPRRAACRCPGQEWAWA
eukprot:6106935-Lingulodinium_polyedra.AAC.1